MSTIRAAVLTVSDRCASGEATDTSGPALVELVRQRLAGEVVAERCVPDERRLIADLLTEWSHTAPQPDLILTTGGTGLSPRDVTPEATLDVLDRRHAGLMELVRLRSFEKTPLAFLSRGEAGTVDRTLVINLPGSERGATESLNALLDVLPHAIETLRGEGRDHQRHAEPVRETDACDGRGDAGVARPRCGAGPSGPRGCHRGGGHRDGRHASGRDHGGGA